MAFSVGKTWEELYPDDLKANTVVARLNQMRGQTDMVLEEYKTILRLDPGKHELLIDIGDLNKDMGDIDKELEYYYLLRGKVDKVFEEMECRFVVLEKIAPLLALLDSRSESLNLYILNRNIDLKLEDVENSEKYIVGTEEAIEALQLEIIRHTIFEEKARFMNLKESMRWRISGIQINIIYNDNLPVNLLREVLYSNNSVTGMQLALLHFR